METKPRLTRGEVYDGDVWRTLDGAVIFRALYFPGRCYVSWRGNVYRVGIEGVTGAIDPPELIGTVGEILGEADNAE